HDPPGRRRHRLGHLAVNNLRFVVRLAWREARAARRRLGLLTASITAGVAALVAVNSFTDNLRLSVAEQAQALLGADLSFASSQVAVDSVVTVQALLDSLTAVGGGEVRIARSSSFAAMAYVAPGGTARLVRARGVDPRWPVSGQA